VIQAGLLQPKLASRAGFRILNSLFRKKHLYVDDLITSEESRSKGFGLKMLEWLQKKAQENNCHRLDLDSGAHRLDAHRFYEKNGLIKNEFHFSTFL
jgi:GNAT superfamily N-acetyltransferase